MMGNFCKRVFPYTEFILTLYVQLFNTWAHPLLTSKIFWRQTKYTSDTTGVKGLKRHQQIANATLLWHHTLIFFSKLAKKRSYFLFLICQVFFSSNCTGFVQSRLIGNCFNDCVILTILESPKFGLSPNCCRLVYHNY